MTPKGFVFAVNKHTNQHSLHILDNYADARVWADKFYYDTCAFDVNVHEVDIAGTPTDEEFEVLKVYTQKIIDLLSRVRKWDLMTRTVQRTQPQIGKPNKLTDYRDIGDDVIRKTVEGMP